MACNSKKIKHKKVYFIKNSMKKKPLVLIVGAGQLGSRYLQGLVPIIDMINIIVVDPKESSLEKAKKIISFDISIIKNNIKFFNNFEEIKVNYVDLAIISSTAKGRADLISKVNSFFNPKYWIIEKILEQSNKKIEQIEKLLPYLRGKAWVNNARRIMRFHREVFNEIKNIRESKIPLDFIYEGSNWGLGCNGIHFIDLISWWISEKEFRITNLKFDKWLPAKRSGYFEPYGKLILKYKDGSILRLICNNEGDSNNAIILKVFKKNKLISEINELKGEANFFNKKIIYGNIELQSEMSGRLVRNILESGDCELTPLEESIYQHKLLIKSLSADWSEFSKDKIQNDYAPVT